ncbi:heavy metal translocating P-type ATPase [Sphaerothrix gracilis]|uniref:heavy metal translocating P-type ATPase n=1 Tax=Sphaerothrix gracilis TaxID=3151835 RepID=UPI0031FBF9E0
MGACHSHSHNPVKTAPSQSGCCGHNHGQAAAEFDAQSALRPFAIALVLFLVGLIFHQPLHDTPFALAEYAVLIPAYLISGWSVLTTAGKNILRGRLFDENFLMTIATLGAIAIHELPEAVGVMLFFQVGELFQDLAVGRSRRSIKSLLAVRPEMAHLKLGEETKSVDPETVAIGSTIVVKPGERVPLDGEVLAGRSQVDTSALTGESVPRQVKPGSQVLAGMINQSGLLTLRVTKRLADSSIVRILDLVENASSQKAATEKFITRFARYYTPVVVFLSLAVAILPPLLLPGATAATWTYRALVLLVISCPCGLVISIPLGYFGGVGGAARRGILVKGATFLDALTQVQTVVFDKTGTLTQGNFKVTELVTDNGFSQAQLLELAAIAEVHSNHPVAQSIRAAYGQSIDSAAVQNYREISGQGIQAQVGDRQVLVGSDRLLHQENIPHSVCVVAGTVAHLAVDGEYAGRVIIADELKPDAPEAVQALQAQGLQTAMLTGDSQSVADRIASQLGLDNYQAELLPEGKVEALEKILQQAQQTGGKVAFVGDGINDAPVIARADVGIAMGGLGSDAAIETADVVIMTDAPSKVAEAIQLAGKTRRIVWQNIALALGVKAIFITLGAVGLASLWAAVFADVGVALLAILNAGRVLNR